MAQGGGTNAADPHRKLATCHGRRPGEPRLVVKVQQGRGPDIQRYIYIYIYIHIYTHTDICISLVYD